MSTRTILYATNNAAKVNEVRSLLEPLGIIDKIVTPRELAQQYPDKNVPQSVEETGATLKENAIIKVQAYAHLFPDLVIVSDDTGLEIDSLNGEPGIYVRRWKDKKNEMTDEEIMNHAVDRMQPFQTIEQRTATFKTVVAVALPASATTTTTPNNNNNNIIICEGILRGYLDFKPSDTFRIRGFPMDSLFHAFEWDNMLMGEVEMSFSAAEKERRKFHSHREKAFLSLKDLLRRALCVPQQQQQQQ